MSVDDSLIGTVVADRYHVLSRLGEGGMGRVYLAEHVRMGRKCALKVISPALATTAEAITRFNREAANASRINHPNVAQVYDFGESSGVLYLAMEFIDGETLDAVVGRDGALPPARAAQIVKQIADALHAAHHLGIVHRDLKPENVMVARHLDGSDWVKVVDFGIAKTVQRDGSGSQTVTTAGVSLGTPEFMSPEQLAGEVLDHRTDIYSLGLLLFTALTGELPYPRVTSKQTLVRRLTSRPRTLSEVRPGIAWPPALQHALDRALAPEVSDRYDSVAELGRDVVSAVGQAETDSSSAPTTLVMPSRQPGPSRPRRVNADVPVSRSVLRRAIPLAVAAALVVVALATGGASWLRSHRTAAHVAARDTSASTIVQQAAAPPTPVPTPAPAAVVPDSAPARPSPATRAPGHTSAKARHHDSTAVPNVRAATKPTRTVHADSVASHPQAAPDTTSSDRSAAAANDIRSHITSMQQRFDAGDPRGARQELGEAVSELAILRDLDADPDRVRELQRDIGQGIRGIIASCYRMRADSTLPPGIRCENLTPARLREARRQR